MIRTETTAALYVQYLVRAHRNIRALHLNAWRWLGSLPGVTKGLDIHAYRREHADPDILLAAYRRALAELQRARHPTAGQLWDCSVLQTAIATIESQTSYRSTA